MNILKAVILTIIATAVNVFGGAYAWNRIQGRSLKKILKRQRMKIKLLNYESQLFKENYIATFKTLNTERMTKVEKQEEYTTNKITREGQLNIIKNYGIEKQLDQLVEESGELIVAIAKTKRYSRPGSSLDHYENLVEELADVKNLIEQIEMDSPYIKEGITAMIKHKTERELDRIWRSK